MRRVFLRRKRMIWMAASLLAAISGVWMIANAAAHAPPAGEKQGGAGGDDKAAMAPVTPDQARHARFVADTLRLSQLAEELKVEVDKSNKDTLSISVVKKAAEVEELARDLKERMKRESPGAR